MALSCPPSSRNLRSFYLVHGSRQLLELVSGGFADRPASSYRRLHIYTHYRLLPLKPRGRTSRLLSSALTPHGFRSYAPLSSPGAVHLEPNEITDNPQEQVLIADPEKIRTERLRDKLVELGIQADSFETEQYMHILCPRCTGGDSKERCFSLFIRGDGKLALWSCFRSSECGWRGRIEAIENGEGFRVNDNGATIVSQCKTSRTITEKGLFLQPLCPEIIEFFNSRGISAETLRRNAVMQRRLGNGEIVIAFTYRRNGKLVNCKYRNIEKKFSQEKDTEKIFYGLDDVVPGNDIIIVEGEIDKLSMEEAGYRNCLSVPNGAVSKVSEKVPSEEQDKGFQYLWACKEHLSKAPRIILATDADIPGQALAEELARRLGKERCWRVTWPIKSGSEICKDANEVLNILGKDALKEVIETAELFPIRGLFTFNSFFIEINEYYNCKGFEMGLSTGWRALDDLYTIVPGELSIITGVPNSGKSEWIDALMCNINENHGWTFALCSMENKVQEHARKLLEKHIKKPFFNVRYGESVERMSPEELEEGKIWLNNSFYLIRCDDDALPSVTWVLDLAKAAVLRYGVRGLVIDPYNELDHQRPNNLSETEYVSQLLTKIKRFAQHHSCHVWFVAHPRQLQNWGGNPPNLYDISGSAHFINKCDNGIIVHRNRNENELIDGVQIIVKKVRNKVTGRIGEAHLSYDRVTGRFGDVK
ncbi:hypothetical protein KSP40_PGU015121 [Platanthera guangdongensis]|uniref:Uncharacterized protein n=1 Tax=Platanthera guangdongensis TaxID=2320717 RepID=A0ABR2N0C2_9ASPA